MIFPTNNKQGGRRHSFKGRTGKIRTTTTGDHRLHLGAKLGGRLQGRACPGTRPEETDGQGRKVWLNLPPATVYTFRKKAAANSVYDGMPIDSARPTP